MGGDKRRKKVKYNDRLQGGGQDLRRQKGMRGYEMRQKERVDTRLEEVRGGKGR